MAKFRPAGSRKAAAKSAKNAIPCAVIVVTGIALITFLFYAVLKSSF